MTAKAILRLVCVCFASGLVAQELNRHGPYESVCPPTRVRITARNLDGSPVGNLTSSDLEAAFGKDPARIVTLRRWPSKRDKAGTTNILFVVPPLSAFTEVSIQQLITWMVHAENLALSCAVMGPDGHMSTFTDDPLQLRKELIRATAMEKHGLSRKQWPASEQSGFLILRGLDGRHVIIDLTNPADPYHSTLKESFKGDRTLEYLSSFDMAQVYRLVAPVPMSSLIPMGDAATEHEDIGPRNHDQKQLHEVQIASEQQDALTAAKLRGIANGGRSETSLEALLADVSADEQGSYEMLLQSTARCDVGGMYPLTITSHRPGVRVFGPVEIQMIPAS